MNDSACPRSGDAIDRQFVSFELAGEKFAVPMGPVQEIIRLPEVARLPLAPPALLGLANLRGRVLPVFSLRRLVGLPDSLDSDNARALVLQGSQSLGITVDKVCSVLQVDSESLHPAERISAVVKSDCLTGLIHRKLPDGDELLMVLDLDRLVRSQMQSLAQRLEREASRSTTDALQGGPLAAAQEQAAESQELRLVSFTAAGQEYALPIEAVQEIVQLPEEITEIPQAPRHVRGVITLRQRLLPLIDLRCLFGLEDHERPPHPRIVVLSPPGEGPVGLVTDAVKEVLGVPRELVDPVPAQLQGSAQGSDLEAICRLDEGRRLVALLSPSRLLGPGDFSEAWLRGQSDEPPSSPDALENTMSIAAPSSFAAVTDTASPAEDDQWVVFRLGDEEFGVPIMVVQEIVRVPPLLTRVPRSPAFIEGVINLRGTVLPVVDQRRRLGLAPVERTDRQRIMVLAHAQQRTGFIVDAVAEVLRVPAHSLQPAPSFDAEVQRLIRQVAHLPGGRLVQQVDPQELMRLTPAGASQPLAA